MGMAAGQRTTIHLWQILAGPGLPKLLLHNLCSELSYHLTAHWDESNLKGRTSNRERRWATPDWNWAAKLKSSCSHGEGMFSQNVQWGTGMREAGICQVAKGGIERRGASRIGWIDGERAQSECRPWASYVISPLHCACSYAGGNSSAQRRDGGGQWALVSLPQDPVNPVTGLVTHGRLREPRIAAQSMS